MQKVTPEQAVAHPNWSMGAKISVDSASMMNKGLELIEAYHLFGLPQEQIEILVHKQSVIHSMVAYVDGSVLAQLGTPDMRTPIAYALGYPKRMESPSPKLDFTTVGSLSFEAPDYNRFPALKLAREALKIGGAASTILNAANEIAVEKFLNKETGFLEMIKIVEQTLEKVSSATINSIEDVLNIDNEARRVASKISF